MNLGIHDHVIAFVLVVVMPITAMRNYPHLVASVRTDPSARARQYRITIATQWALVAIVLGVWFAVGRTPAEIGLAFPLDIATLVGAAITATVLVLLYRQTADVLRGGEAALAALREQIGSVDALIPRTDAEARWFRGMAVTAGICEEVLYRGFLIAYLGAWIGAWPAVGVASILFGVAHVYQGRANALKAAILSFLPGALYVGCGTLLWPMILHAVIDLHGGLLGRLAVTAPGVTSPR
jgi:membrane protease YdiL (CAAX protease family)